MHCIFCDFRCVRPFWFLATRTWFDGLITFIVMLNLIPIFWELAYYSHEHDFEFFIVNIVFMGIYILEFLIKVSKQAKKLKRGLLLDDEMKYP